MTPPTPTRPILGIPVRGAAAGFRRFTVDEYHKLIELGILTEDDDLELLDGHLVQKMSRNPPHDGTLDIVRDALTRAVPAGWFVRVQAGLTLATSEPEPDFLVVRGNARSYTQRHPVPADAGLVVEVADTSLDTDRQDKIPLYAHAGIPTYWIVNIPDRQVEVYTDPDPNATPPVYGTRTDYRPGQNVLVALTGVTVVTIPVADLLP